MTLAQFFHSTPVVVTYIVNFIGWLGYVWLQYLDVSTTLKVMNYSNGAEANPAMKPYVKKGQPWLMAKGKLINGGWAGIIYPFLPLLFPLMVWKSADLWKNAVQTNQHLLGSGRLK